MPVFLAALVTLVLVTANAAASRSANMAGKQQLWGPAIPPIDAAAPKTYETATFAEGCFWGVESRFGSLDGVIRTRVGYAGGSTLNPTYHDIGDHSESVQLDYDPSVISYDQLLDVFWNSQDPTLPSGIKQYASLILYGNDRQREAAEASRQRLQQKLDKPIQTEIVPLGNFYLAEDYHQKWDLQQNAKIMSEFRRIYPRMRDFINSTAATRINGYLGGNGTLARLQKDLSSFGLSAAGSAELVQSAAGVLAVGGSATCPVPDAITY